MPTFVARANDRLEIRQLRMSKGEAVPVIVDFSPWADDGGAVTTATWTVKAGNATISGEALSSSSASAVVTTAEEGGSIIEVKGAGATHTKIVNIQVFAKDPSLPTNDYGFAHP